MLRERLLAARLADPRGSVRDAAWEVLTKLGAEETLAQHAAVLVAKLEDFNWQVQMAARVVMHKLEPAAGHMDAVVAKLEDSEKIVRYYAVETLGELDVATLAQHGAALVAKLDDSEKIVRQAAAQSLGKLDLATLAQHEQAIAKAAKEDKDYGVRRAADEVLAKLRAGK